MIPKSATEDSRYLQSCESGFWQNIFRVEADYIARRLEGCADVLSIGCGPAIIESDLAARGFHVVGVDVSREALDCAPDNVRTVLCRAEDINFGESSFDAVIFVVSLQFIEDFAKALKRAARVLRPKGRLIVMLLNPESEFFKERVQKTDSYVRKIRHMALSGIESEVSRFFKVETEYFLGISGDRIFDSALPSESALYIINGTPRLGEWEL